MGSDEGQGVLRCISEVESIGSIVSMKTLARIVASLPKRKAEFIEPIDCAPVTKLVNEHAKET